MEECFSRFLNCTNGTKSHNASHMLYCSSHKHGGIIARKNKFIRSGYVEISLNSWIDCCCSLQ